MLFTQWVCITGEGNSLVNPHVLQETLNKTVLSKWRWYLLPQGGSLQLPPLQRAAGTCLLGRPTEMQHEKPVKGFLSQQGVKVLTEVKRTRNRSISLSVKIPKVINRVTKSDNGTFQQWEKEEIQCNKA